MKLLQAVIYGFGKFYQKNFSISLLLQIHCFFSFHKYTDKLEFEQK